MHERMSVLSLHVVKPNMTEHEISYCTDVCHRTQEMTASTYFWGKNTILKESIWRTTHTWSQYTGSWVPWPDVPAWTDKLGQQQRIYEGVKTSCCDIYTVPRPAENTTLPHILIWTHHKDSKPGQITCKAEEILHLFHRLTDIWMGWQPPRCLLYMSEKNQ